MTALIDVYDGLDGAFVVNLNRRGAGDGRGVMVGPRSGLDLGKVALPDLQADSVVWSPMTGPEHLASRTVTLPLVAFGSDPDDLAAWTRAVNTAVAKPFWLKIRRHAATGVAWLRCWPTAPQWESQITSVDGPGTIQAGKLTARTDPYAYGSRVDVTTTVTQDPASSSAWVMDVVGVSGDAPTPAIISSSDGALLGVDHAMLISVRSRGNPASIGQLATQGEACYLSAGGPHAPTVVTFTGNTDFSGGAGARVTFPSGNTGLFNSYGGLAVPQVLTGSESPGTYRALVRVRRSGASAGLEHTIRIAANPMFRDVLFTAGGNNTRVIDLGLIQLPTGQPAWHASPLPQPWAWQPPITLFLMRSSSGAGTLDVDWFALIPSDEGAGLSQIDTRLPNPGEWWMVDGYDHVPRLFWGSPLAGGIAVGQRGGTRFVGGVPMLRPGANRLWFVGGLGATSAALWPPTKQFSVTVSHFPRYRWLA